ncbi:hypothetical protein ElyMa_000302300 [Elysia marginata]|uniref:Uncharacterized protein n=1 Tax=Elysia marginata TaxID=1093978 RepID=A0AAV4F9N0_9GAST|nr:hypothetical protein ElyMa_000302300 [Elysia marginata]
MVCPGQVNSMGDSRGKNQLAWLPPCWGTVFRVSISRYEECMFVLISLPRGIIHPQEYTLIFSWSCDGLTTIISFFYPWRDLTRRKRGITRVESNASFEITTVNQIRQGKVHDE